MARYRTPKRRKFLINANYELRVTKIKIGCAAAVGEANQLSIIINRPNVLAHLWLGGFYPKIIPAMAADSREANDPPSTARMPNSERVLRWPGAKEPMPPIWMPMDAKLANPQSI